MLSLDPFDAGGGAGFRLRAELPEDLLDVLHVLPRLIQVLLESLRKLFVLRLLLKPRKHLHDRLLCREDVSELVEEELTWFAERWHITPLFSLALSRH